MLYFFFFKQKTAYEMRISAGVQTCALPISTLRLTVVISPRRYMSDNASTGDSPASALSQASDDTARISRYRGLDFAAIATRSPVGKDDVEEWSHEKLGDQSANGMTG